MSIISTACFRDSWQVDLAAYLMSCTLPSKESASTRCPRSVHAPPALLEPRPRMPRSEPLVRSHLLVELGLALPVDSLGLQLVRHRSLVISSLGLEVSDVRFKDAHPFNARCVRTQHRSARFRPLLHLIDSLRCPSQRCPWTPNEPAPIGLSTSSQAGSPCAAFTPSPPLRLPPRG